MGASDARAGRCFAAARRRRTARPRAGVHLRALGRRRLAALLPQTFRARLHTVLLDSITAEQAARTVAMQTASTTLRSCWTTCR